MDIVDGNSNSANADKDIFDSVKQIVQVGCVDNDVIFSKLTDIIETGKTRIVLPISTLNSISANFSSRMTRDPYIYFPPTEAAVGDVIKSLIVPKNMKFLAKNINQLKNVQLGITGWLGLNSVTPRGVHSNLVNQMIMVEGIVTHCSYINARLTKAGYYIPDLDRHFYRMQNDSIAIQHNMNKTSTNNYNIFKDNEGHAVELEYGLSEFKDIQILTLQEMLEVTPTGQLPRSIEVVCEEDLVSIAKPGDRCRVYGVLRANVSSNNRITSGYSRLMLVANNIEIMQKDFLLKGITDTLIRQFQEIRNHHSTLDLIAASICPSIYGLLEVRQGLALQLVGGVAKTIETDGTKLRGDIHILLIGDPSCGKSQLLRYMMKLFPICISTTGRGSSAVGLTAAIVNDPETRQNRIEAGAMVIADGGLVCIDEFDKMNAEDRVAVHEVMEQQSVSINKAGIIATLNARTSVLAAANPIYGSFDEQTEYNKQIAFPDSLLSRFDLIYVIKETNSPFVDRQIAQQVLAQLRIPFNEDLDAYAFRQRAMRSRNATHTLVQPIFDLDENNYEEGTVDSKKSRVMWMKHPANYADSANNNEQQNKSIIHHKFLKLYINYCRTNITPELTDDACDEIANFYAYLRNRIYKDIENQIGNNNNSIKALPTPRLLEACIRLSTAHAKLKMKSTVDVEDVERIKKLLLYTLCDYNETNVEAENTEQYDNNDKKSITNKTTGFTNIQEYLDDDFVQHNNQSKKAKLLNDEFVKKPDYINDQVETIYEYLSKCQIDDDIDVWNISQLVQKLNSLNMITKEDDINKILKILQELNRIMIVNDKVYII